MAKPSGSDFLRSRSCFHSLMTEILLGEHLQLLINYVSATTSSQTATPCDMWWYSGRRYEVVPERVSVLLGVERAHRHVERGQAQAAAHLSSNQILYSAIPLYSETRVSMTDALSPPSVAPSRCRTCEYPAWNVDIADEDKHIFVLSCSEMYVCCFD
jgi:hypothetical protein